MAARPSRMMLGTGTATLALALAAGPFLLGTSPASAAAPSDIIICHATGATGNPYITNSPAKTADAGGHDSHGFDKDDVQLPIYYVGITGSWGDIIPPFDYPATQQDPAGTYPGLNWTAAGQAIYNNGCVMPAAEPTPTPTQPTPTPTQPTPTPTEPTPTPTEPTPTPTEPTPTPTEPTPTPTEPEPSPSESPITGGGGTVVIPPADPAETPAEETPITGGSGTVTTAEELPLTGDRTGTLAAWASLMVAAGIGLVGAGTRKATR